MKPMLAATVKDVDKLNFPLYASPKIDGIRVVIRDAIAFSRTLKPIPNRHIQFILGREEFNGLDGEITVGPAFARNVMQMTSSGVMSEDGHPDFTYWVFDFWTSETMPFSDRFQAMRRADKDGVFAGQTKIQLLQQKLILNTQELTAYEATCLSEGYEGVMLRAPLGQYKYGRSTMNQGFLMKLKRFVDSEAVVIGFEERFHNANQATTNELGYTTRSSHQENQVPCDTLGALVVKDLATGVTFSIGNGFNDVTRKEIWTRRQNYIDQIVTYKHFENTGVKAAPRFPVFKAFRHPSDM